MGLLDFFKPKKKAATETYVYAPTYSGDRTDTTSYSSGFTNVYKCDLILQAIHAKQGEFMKIKPRHITMRDGVECVDETSSVTKVLRRPNPYMTAADFFSKIVFLHEVNKNCYIYPEYYLTNAGKKVFTGLYPLNPQQVDYLVDNGGRYFIAFTFRSGYKCTIPIEDIIHWRKDYDGNDYFGGNSYSNGDLLAHINEYDSLCKSISKAVGASCQVNGLVRVNTYLDDEKIEKQRVEFENKLTKNESGILFTDLKTDYVPMQRDVKLVDAETLKFFNDNILRATGTPAEILSGNYTKQVKESWYERTLEPDLRSLAQAMEKVFFSDREESFGNKIILYPQQIVFMSMENKISALQVGLPAGIFTRDEARELLGYPPLPNGLGQEIPQGYNNTITATGGCEE